jgi:hypothetical protein
LDGLLNESVQHVWPVSRRTRRAAAHRHPVCRWSLVEPVKVDKSHRQTVVSQCPSEDGPTVETHLPSPRCP